MKNQIYKVLFFFALLPMHLNAQTSEQLTHLCKSCHAAGSSRYIPNINGQPEAYLKRTMLNYRSGIFPSVMMQRIAVRLKDQEIDQLSHYFSNKKSHIKLKEGIELAPSAGQLLYQQQCIACHKNQELGIPEIRGLPQAYIEDVMETFKQGRRLMPESMGYYIANLDQTETKQLIEYLSAFEVVTDEP